MFEYLIFLFFFFPAFAEEIPDYNDPYSPIFTDKPVYSWTDKVKMTIIAPSWNADRDLIDSIGDHAENPIKISTRDHSLDPYRFTETGTNTGIFTAEVILTGFSHDATGDGTIDTTPRTIGNGPTSGFLEVDRDSAITISFEFADGVVLTESAPISWNLGTIQFSDVNFISSKTAQIRVIDLDMNLNPEGIDQIPIRVSSDSDVAGIEVDAIETSKSSGVFVANISFSQNLPSSGSRLFAIPGDSIYAKYDDHTLPRPYTLSDNVEIIAIGELESSVLPIERIKSSQVILSDSFGNELKSFSTYNQVQIVGTIINEQNFKQQFIYLFQVKDSSDAVVSISWITGEISPNQSLDISQSWMPSKLGSHFIETFVWTSLTDPTPLSQSQSIEIFVE